MNFMNARGNTKLNAAVDKVESNVAEQDATGKKNVKTDSVRRSREQRRCTDRRYRSNFTSRCVGFDAENLTLYRPIVD